jgi:phosphotransferase system enzyme I (PtsI)
VGELLHGLAVSPGFAAGPLFRVSPPPDLPAPSPVAPEQIASEVERARAALAGVAADLRRRAASASKPAIGEILGAQAMMAEDPVLHDTVAEQVTAGQSAPHAIAAALATHREAFLAAGGYLAERAADLDDLRDRAVAACLGLAMPGIPSPGHPYVLAARDLAPADTAGLDPAVVLALVTEGGGPTSHTAIVARSLGIPAVVRCAGILGIQDGAAVAVDGGTGQVRVDPDEALVADLRGRDAERRARLAASSGPGRTSDGHPVALLANIGSVADLTGEGGAGAEGVGLFRTELLYLDRATAPSLADQVGAYRAVFEAAAGRRVVVRTLDAGADKPMPFLSQVGEPNPALGIRGLRLGWQQPEILRTQLEAIATAAGLTGAQVWVMAPMVATAAEARQFAAWCRDAGLPKVGVMVEIPAAALRAAALLAEVDFLSIGTNDLSQYTFAADRMCGELAELLDPWQPALLSLIAACGEAGQAAGKSVGICGEAASDPALAPVLAGLGIGSLSMAPRAIPAVRESLAAVTRDDCRRLAGLALAAADATTARALAQG